MDAPSKPTQYTLIGGRREGRMVRSQSVDVPRKWRGTVEGAAAGETCRREAWGRRVRKVMGVPSWEGCTRRMPPRF